MNLQDLINRIIAAFGFKRSAVEQAVQKVMKTKLDTLADAIEKFEGMDKNCHNPGALRYSFYEDGQKCYPGKGCFAYFATYAQGRKALIHQLTIVANGSSPAYNAIARRKGYANCGELNLQEFFAIYAPSSDHNDPLNYVKYIALQTGFSALTKVKELLSA